MTPTTGIWIFGKFSKLHKSWTYAVHAVSLADARQTMQASRIGGTLLRKVSENETEVQDSCGIVSEEAQAVFCENLKRFMAVTP